MDENIDYCIKKTNILLVEIKMFTHIEGNVIVEKKLKNVEKYRKVLFYDHMFIDFKTGDLLEDIYDRDGFIKRPICENVMYIATTYAYPETTDDDLIEAAKLYEMAVLRRRLFESKKLIKFPAKVIY